MKSAWKIFRFIVFTMAFILIAIPVSLYIILSTNWAQNDIRRVAGNELSALLGTDVTLGRVEIHPFNRLSIYDIKAQDDYGKTALSIDEISVAFELFYLLRTGKLVVDFALVDAPSLSLYKKTSTSSLNIAEILKGLKSDNKNKPQSHYDLMVNTVIIRDGEMKFDILDAPERDSIFDVKHIAVSDVFLNAYIPRISNDEYRVEIDRFSLKEQHGFELTNLKAAADITPHGSDLEYLTLRFPNSELSINPVSLDNNGFSGLEEIFNDGGINVGIRPGSIIYPPDFSAFAPQLVSFQDSIEIILDGNISADHALVNRMTIAQPDGKFVGVVSAKAENIKDGVNASFEIEEFRFSAQKSGLSDMLKLLPHSNPQAEKLISGMKSGDNLSINVKADGKINN